MSSDLEDKCLVCLKAGRIYNIFTTYNMRIEKVELYVDVIKNCFNIEICPDTGLNALCNACSMKLKKAYNFRHDMLKAVEKLISAQDVTTNDKQFSEIEYLEDIPFAADYDIDTVLDTATGQISYTLDEIYNKEINESDSYLLDLDNDVVDKVLFEKSNDVSDVTHNNEIDDKAGKPDSELNLQPVELCVLDKPVENCSIDILNDVLVGNDLEPGEIRIIDKTVASYLIDAKNEVIVDKKKVVVKGKGKINARNDSEGTTLVNQEEPLDTIDEIPANMVNASLVDVIENKNKLSKNNRNKKNVKKIQKCETVLSPAGTLDEINIKDLIKVKRKVSKRVKNEKDEISLLAQICTKQQNPDENTPANSVKEVNEPTKNEQTGLMDIGNDNDVDINASIKSKTTKRSKKKKEGSVKENVSGNVGEVKVKKPRKERKPKSPPPFTLRPEQTRCDLCGTRFETPRALSMHMNTHYPQYVCGVCGAEMATKNRLRQHLRSHEEGPFTCKICDKQFSNSNTRNAHTWRVHSKGDPFKCKRCEMRFPTYLQRLRHVQRAHGETPEYGCQFCPAKFAYAANRKKHIRVMHLESRPHQCPSCPSAFARARTLAAHRASKHGHGSKPHRCPVCGLGFYFRSALRWHVNQHRHNFPCNQCDQKFATSSELESHTQIHEHADNMAINLDFVTSLHLDALADDYALIDPSYLDLNEL